PADLQKRKTFSWCPGWVIILFFIALLPWLIVTLILTKRMTVYVPLCNKHKNHWFIRSMIVLGGLAVVFGILALGIVLMRAANQNQNGIDWSVFVCVARFGALVILIIIAVILQQSAIRATEIANRRITLTGVADEFKEALRKQDAKDTDVPERYDERFHERPKRPKSDEFYDREGGV